MKGRSITEQIRLIDDITQIALNNNIPGMLVSLDFRKAIDTFEKNTILAALKKFDFGDNFINMVRVLITNTESTVQNGGWLSDWIKTERGIKQGCCVSPLLFILVAEIMSIKIRNNDNIKGIHMEYPGKNINFMKMLQSADDSTLILKSKCDLIAALNDVENFASVSGLQPNRQKSHGMWIGSCKNCADKPCDINWTPNGGTIKILGIYFSATTEASLIELNWRDKVEQIKKIIKTWFKRDPSLYGKVIVCTTFLL
jgi:hypothetical protein